MIFMAWSLPAAGIIDVQLLVSSHFAFGKCKAEAQCSERTERTFRDVEVLITSNMGTELIAPAISPRRWADVKLAISTDAHSVNALGYATWTKSGAPG